MPGIVSWAFLSDRILLRVYLLADAAAEFVVYLIPDMNIIHQLLLNSPLGPRA